ncbi:hypothetical protein BS78_08G095900 [Paspalum vaginatum]|nr:hypothetical protein BS78_08G095900 [Paspalum vaginatum]
MLPMIPSWWTAAQLLGDGPPPIIPGAGSPLWATGGSALPRGGFRSPPASQLQVLETLFLEDLGKRWYQWISVYAVRPFVFMFSMKNLADRFLKRFFLKI